MKKFLNGIVAVSIAVAGSFMFYSCKDNDEDMFDSLKSEQLAMSKEIAGLKEQLGKCCKDAGFATEAWVLAQKYLTASDLDGYVKDADFLQLQRDFNDWVTAFNNAGYATKSDLQNLKTEIEGLMCKDCVTHEELQTLETALRGEISALEGRLNSIESELNGKIDAISGRLDDLEDNPFIAGILEMSPEEQQAFFDNLKGLADEKEAIDELLALCEGLGEYLEGSGFETVVEKFQNIDLLLNDLEERVSTLETLVDQLTQRVDNLVTGILVQGIYNPVFGSLSTPFNVNSNILLGYYGVADGGVNFPAFGKSQYEYNNTEVLTASDLANIGSVKGGVFELGQGETIGLDKDNNLQLGTVYMTLNPTNVNFDGKEFSLESSNGTESAAKLTGVTKSDVELTFGYSRADEAASGNGFYEAQAYVPENSIGDIKLDIESGLKSAMKNAIKGHTVSDFAALIKVVYDQFNGILPAYALKTTWQEYEDGPFNSVFSQYSVAATAFKPLSFKFGEGYEFSRRLPVINALNSDGIKLNPDDYKFDLSGVEVNLNGVKATLDFNLKKIEFTYDGELELEIEGVTEDGQSVTVTGKVKPEDIQDLLTDMAEQLNSKIDEWNEDLKVAFEEALQDLVNQIAERVDDFVGQLEAKVNQNIEDIINDINDELNGKIGKYLNRFNSFIDKYNKVANRINNILADPNHYLQVMMVYEGVDGDFHHLSTDRSIPSVANAGAITFYPTTYTAEIVVPVAKKYVAVTNVFDKNGNQVKSEISAANANSTLNTVLPGKQTRVAFQGKAGYTYEIAYSALDYQGFTSTRKYYITVK